MKFLSIFAKTTISFTAEMQVSEGINEIRFLDRYTDV